MNRAWDNEPKRWACGGREFARAARHRVLRPHLGRVGVSAVTVHQGHARSASHWQARSTDLKLSQTPPRPRQMWRAVASLCAGGLAPRGPQASLLELAGVQTRTPGSDRGSTAGRIVRQSDRETDRQTDRTEGGGGSPSGKKATVCRCKLGCRCRTRCSAQRTAQRFQGAGARPVRECRPSLVRPNRYSTTGCTSVAQALWCYWCSGAMPWMVR